MKTIAAVLMTTLSLLAQRVPLADGSRRELCLVDVGDLLAGANGPEPHSPEFTTNAGHVAAFSRRFAGPTFSGASDLQPCGDRHLVVLGTTEQVAAVERLVAAARNAREELFQIDVKLCSVSVRFFDAKLAAKVKALEGAPATRDTPRVAVLTAADVAEILKSLAKDPACGVLQAPHLTVRSMQHATIAVGEQVAYVRDLEVEAVDGTFIADPVVDTLWHGQRVEAMCAKTPAGSIGVQMEVLDQSVERPLREIKTVIPGTTIEATVHVPRVVGCRGSQAAELPSGSTAVMAAMKQDGSWLVSFMTVTAIR